MENVLEVYHRPFDPAWPLEAVDEASKQLVGEVAPPLPPEPGKPERFDYEYVCRGTANPFMVSEPLLGWREVRVTERRGITRRCRVDRPRTSTPTRRKSCWCRTT